MAKQISATVQVKVATCCRCDNPASVTMIDDQHQIIQVCPEHHIARFQDMLIERVRLILDSPELLEILADIEHARWSGWEEYRAEKSGGLHVSGESYESRWRRQRLTDYADLNEREKESDRIEARKGLAAIRVALLGPTKGATDG